METLSHISFSVTDLEESSKFYDATLGSIGLKRVYSGESSAGWGTSEDKEVFAIKKRVNKASAPSPGFHLAFHARTEKEVHAFYEKALKNGAKDNGRPGPRPKHGNGYYAAFVIDPDGYELEIKLFI